MGEVAILIVEDNVVNQRVAAALLKRAGYTVLLASNGLEALEAIDRKRPDLVLMDIQMPVMDGFEATAAIREAERHGRPHLPIVALTANAAQGDRERCLEAGMDGYIPKPIDKKKMHEEIDRALQLAN